MSYFFRRFLLGLLAIFMIASTTFVLMHSVPGDPLAQERGVSKEIRENLRARYGLNLPIHQQYLAYISNIFLKFDLGMSFKQENRSVNRIIADHFWVSAVLGLAALTGAMIFGIFLGAFAALKRGSWVETLAMLVGVVGVSVPSFCIAYIVQHIFAIQWKILPVAGWGGVASIVLPALSLGFIAMASITRLMRSSMMETLQQDFIRTAKARGVGVVRRFFKHELRNAVLPVVVYFGPLFAAVTTGTFVIEVIFGIPGLGQFFVSSVAELDYTVIMGLTVFYAAFNIFILLVNDMVLTWIDPRIRLGVS